MTIRLEDLFSDAHDGVAAVERFEAFKGSLDDALLKTARGEFVWRPEIGAAETVAGPTAHLEETLASVKLDKTASPDVVASLTAELERRKAVEADLMKDISLTSPISSGLVPIDLEAPAKMLTPRPTPLRNRLPRVKGIGKARTFKRITGFSGTGSGGVAAMRASINDSSTMASGSLTLRRGPKITYAGDEKTIPYKQFGLSDVVTWSAEFAGLGFTDPRQLSETTLLYASMLADERHILGGRGTDSGFVGAIAAPAGLTLTARAAAGSEVGLQGGRYWVKVTALSVFGESVLSASIDLDTVTAGQVIDVKVGTEPTGAVGYRVYAARVAAAGADPGDAAKFSQGTTGYNTFVLTGNPLITSGVAASTIVADTSATADEYDGFLGFLLDPTQSGAVRRINAALSTSTPGSEVQSLLASLYDSVKADPEELWFNGFDRKQQSDALIGGTTTPGYRLTVTQDEASNGVVLGSIVSAIVNEITGRMVDALVHPWMPQGNALALSWDLPIPDSEVDSAFKMVLPQDYMAINWPVIQHTYDASTYWFGALVPYAPAWSGAIAGIKKVA